MKFKSGIIGLSLLTVIQPIFAASDSDSIRVIIKYKNAPIALSSIKSQITKATELPVKAIDSMANGAYSLVLDSSKYSGHISKKRDLSWLVLEKLRQNPEVLYAVKDRVGHFKPVPDPVTTYRDVVLSHESQWDEFTRPSGIMLESAPGLRNGAWAYTTGQSSKPVVVAVLDTGVESNEGLVNSLLKEDDGRIAGWNFSKNNRDLSDETHSYHGTHVSGTIAGYSHVMTGVGQDLKILTLKIPDATGLFYESAVINAIYWSVGEEVPGLPKNHYPASVLNMSFGVDEKPGKEIDYCDEAMQEAIFFARNKGAVLVAAAGNDNVWEHYNAPAACNGTIKVASTGPEGLRSYFSNYGPSVTLAAPGGDKRYGVAGGILSTVNPGGGYHHSGYDFYQGTSMASPHVAGVAGLVFAVSDQSLSPEQIEQLLYVTTHEFGKSSDDNRSCIGKKPCGHGILDAENAVKTALAKYDLLLSAPRLRSIDTKVCGDSKLMPKKQSFSNERIQWVLDHSDCLAKDHFQNPHVKEEKDGSIYAYYGVVRYRLEHFGYKECHVIGYDGVGCLL